MENLIFSLNATAPVFLMMLLGMLFRRLGWIDEAFASRMNRFVFLVPLPVLVFHDLASAEIGDVWNFRFVAFCFLVTAASIAICALLHDLCKAQYYKVSTRNVKNEQTGQWEKVPYYTVEDAFPYGHGEKSVYLIERFLRLKPAEAMAIRWHMGGFDEAARGGSFAISAAYDKYPLAVKLHLADLEATYLREHGTSAVRG